MQENPDTKNGILFALKIFISTTILGKAGKKHVLSEEVTKFELEFLESETALAEGGF
ncbi:MAG: hypothetical protein Ct9H300mP28_03100 [Pseudomonadota bacterium]|nr:MAG: hypothetical protein Ct9H300mP28_03100 [Pseudomonadota bacterium]